VEEMKEFGERLNEILNLKGIRQIDLADKINMAQNTMSQYITDIREPDLEKFVKICKALDVSADKLLGLDPISKISSPDEEDVFKGFINSYVGMSDEGRSLMKGLISFLYERYGK
jgi:transcriptional regulator with XRE-family HTH domain